MKTFLNTIFKDTMDVYSLATASYVFIVIIPIELAELKRIETRFTHLDILSYSFEIPMALQIVIVSVLLTTLVNYFRLILNIVLLYIRKKLRIQDKVN